MPQRSRSLTAIATLGATALAAAVLVQSTLTAGQRQNPTNRTSAASAAHWPRFRGPDSNPVAENPSLPVS